MEEKDFEGTLVLEKMAQINKFDDFMEAVDNDNYRKAQELMKKAGVDAKTIAIVLKKMHEAADDL